MREESNTQKVKSITHNEGYLAIYFTREWAQEDIGSLADILLLSISSVVVKDKNIGADREDIRFTWHEFNFVLNFDCYSESCWIEGQDELATSQLKLLYSVIA